MLQDKMKGSKHTGDTTRTAMSWSLWRLDACFVYAWGLFKIFHNKKWCCLKRKEELLQYTLKKEDGKEKETDAP